MVRRNKILLLDFDEILFNAISDWLKNFGDFEVFAALSKDELNLSLNPKIIMQFLSTDSLELKDEDFQLPLLIIETAAQKANKKHENLLKAPFRLPELEIKIRSILRAFEQSQLESLNIFGHFYVAAKRALIDKNGSQTKLTDKEIEILSYLHQSGGKPISREELLREVWRYNEGVSTHTLETHIYRLRQKLNIATGGKEALVTDDGGYRLIF